MPAIVESLNLTWIDLIAIVFILLSGVHGLVRKFSGELAHLLSFLAALCIGRWAYAHAPDWEWLKRIDSDGRGGPALVFIAAALTALLCMLVLRWMLRKIMTVAFDPRIDRLFGLFAGLFRGSIIVMLIFLAMNAIPFKPLNDVFGDSTRIGKLVIDVTPTLRDIYRKHIAVETPETEPPASPVSTDATPVTGTDASPEPTAPLVTPTVEEAPAPPPEAETVDKPEDQAPL